ncbi:MAG: hypothetical protein Kow0032_00800 [Methyloligellaceae bacterium]
MTKNAKRCAGLLMLAAASPMMLSGCAAIRATGTGGSITCLAFSPITYAAANDSPETVKQIRQHNAAWDALCDRRK